MFIEGSLRIYIQQKAYALSEISDHRVRSRNSMTYRAEIEISYSEYRERMLATLTQIERAIGQTGQIGATASLHQTVKEENWHL